MTAALSLRDLGACAEAVAWAESHGGDLAAIWRDCPRGDWLIWYAERRGATQPDLVRAAASCAEAALPYAGEIRTICEAAVGAARAWAADPCERAVYAAAYAARAAAYAAYAATRQDIADIVRRDLAAWAREAGLA